MRLSTPALLIGLAFLLSGCGLQQRRIAGDYRLEQWEDFKTYYLHRRGHDDSAEGGSIIGGTVLQIGWSDRFIVAKRQSISRSDPDGWMIIDVRSDTMTGPFTDAEMRGRSDVQGIEILEVSEAWKKL